MKFRYGLLALMAVVAALGASAAIPSGYYSKLDGKSGQSLKNAIYDIVRPHTQLTYSALWNCFKSTDVYSGTTNRVWDMYSNTTRYYTSTSGLNREHSLPKSWWGGAQVEAYTDLNHLYPSDSEANSAKSNYPLGEVATILYENGVTKVGTAVSGQGGGAARVFEPADEYKGDFARTYFYMVTCYQDYTWKYTYMASNATYLSLQNWAINLLLKWARQDPVSDKEKDRNEAVYKLQNNRNPFIDYPELFEYIWGSKAGQVFNRDGSSTGGETGGDSTNVATLVTPTQDTEFDFGDVAIGKSIDMVLYVKGQYLTNALTLQLYRDNYAMFSTSVTSIDRNSAMTDNGYMLTLTYTPTEIGSHKAKLLLKDGGIVGSVGVQLKGRCLPVPTLKAVNALPAQDITDSTYVATWEAASDTVDYYVVKRSIYDSNHNLVLVDSVEVDQDETSYVFTIEKGQSQTYTVLANRLGYESPAGNVITVIASGVTGIEADRPLALQSIEGGVRVLCSEPLENVRIYDISGRLVRVLEVVDNNEDIYLPTGVYILTSARNNNPAKVAVR